LRGIDKTGWKGGEFYRWRMTVEMPHAGKKIQIDNQKKGQG